MAPISIALVDDEAPVRVALGRLLRLANYEVHAYASGEEFLAALTHARPDCAVLDVHLPGLTGLEVEARLRAGHAHLPVVFITASEDPAVDRDVAQAGTARLLHKPFSNDELLASIAAAMGGTAAGR